MKPILILVLAAILLTSCEKEDTNSRSTSNFGFTGNSVDYRWDFAPNPSSALTGANLWKTTSANTNDTIYILTGVNQASNIELKCAIHTSQLKPSVYRTVTSMSDPWIESICRVNGELYGTRTGDVVTVTITSMDRNFVSGTFGAVMHDLNWGGLQEYRIWNGYFNRVEIPH